MFVVPEHEVFIVSVKLVYRVPWHLHKFICAANVSHTSYLHVKVSLCYVFTEFCKQNSRGIETQRLCRTLKNMVSREKANF